MFLNFISFSLFQVLTAFNSLEARSYRKRNMGGQLSSKITKNKKLKKKKKKTIVEMIKSNSL